MNFTNEQMTKAKQAKTAEELLAMAKESGIELTGEQAAKYFAELHKEGELSDDELDAVAGGKGDDDVVVEKPEETPTFFGYPIRDSGWRPCEEMTGKIGTCGSCRYFDYQTAGYNIGNCNGYCTKGF